MFMPQSGVPGYAMAGQVQLPLVDGSEAPIGAVYYSAEQREDEADVSGQNDSGHTRANESLGYGGTATEGSLLAPTKPQNFLPFSIVTCMFCNPLFGIVAVYYSFMSNKMYTRGDIATSTKYGQTALGVAILGMVLTGVIVAVVLLTGALGTTRNQTKRKGLSEDSFTLHPEQRMDTPS